MFKQFIGLFLTACLASSASAAVIKYELKDVIGSNGATVSGSIYQSTTDGSILMYTLDLRSKNAGMQFGSSGRFKLGDVHNNFGGYGPTSFHAATNNGDYTQWLDLEFLPGTHQDVVVRGSARQEPNEYWGNTFRAAFAIQYGSVTSSIVTDEAILKYLRTYEGFEMKPVISQAVPIEVPEPESLPLLLIAGAAAFAASKRRKAA